MGSAVEIGFMAASTYMSMKAARQAGIQAEVEAAYRNQDFLNQIEVVKVRSAEALLDINERNMFASDTLNNRTVLDVYSGSGLAFQNRINKVTGREKAANTTNTKFDIANLKIGITSNAQGAKFAKKSANMQATAAFLNFGKNVAQGFSQAASAAMTGGKKIDTSKYKQGHLPWQNTKSGL